MNADRCDASRRRLARRLVGRVLRSWRWPRFRATPAALGIVDRWELAAEPDGALAARLQMRCLADPCTFVTLARELRAPLLGLGLASVVVEAAVQRPWRLSDMDETARLELGL